MTRPLYLDHHATTPVDPRVFEAMRPFFTEVFGNPASRSHAYGWEAEEAVEDARAQVAALVGARPEDVVFTSGATEANNLAIRGVLGRFPTSDAHVVTTAIEHASVWETCRRLETEGVSVTYVPVNRDGRVEPGVVEASLTDRTVLISVMTANNEVGTLQPIAEVGRMARDRGILFHTDAVASAVFLAMEGGSSAPDLISISGHKMYGPKGIGALVARGQSGRRRLAGQIDGGGQERGLRSGTLNVPGIVGLGAACGLARHRQGEDALRIAALRDRLRELLVGSLDGVVVHGSLTHRLPNNLSIGVHGVDGEALVSSLRELAVSSGSACASARKKPSRVLMAMGVSPDLAQATLRFGLGRSNTLDDVGRAAESVIRAVRRLRERRK